VVDVAEEALASEVLRPDGVIVAVDGEPVTLPDELRSKLAAHAPGDTVALGIRRSSTPAGESASSGEDAADALEVDAELIASDAEKPAESRAVLGVTVEPFNPRIESDVDVTIDSGEVTGPSAGLAWSLAIVDVLTPGSLTGDRDVAVTGEILPDGSVGVIGGTAQKTSTVVRNGVDVFMYPADTPADEQAEMRRIAGDRTELVPVSSLSEAVDYLAPDGVGVD